MGKIKFDGLIEAVHYAPDGKIDFVRAYERRGATFSDHKLIARTDLIARLKKGEKFVTGMRKEFMGSTFETAKTVSLMDDVIFTGNKTNRDMLEEVPSL